MKLVHLNRVGTKGNLYVVRDFVAPVDPGYGTGAGGLPDNSLPSNPAFPDNSLPTTPATPTQPGEVLVLVRDPEGIWHYAALAPGSPPPRPVPPMPPEHISGQPVPPMPTPV